MKLVLHRAAEADLDELITHIRSRAGVRVASRQLEKATSSLGVIAEYPRAAKYDAALDIYEAWLPGTRFIAFYRIRNDLGVVVVLAIIDHARNTTRFKGRLIKSRD